MLDRYGQKESIICGIIILLTPALMIDPCMEVNDPYAIKNQRKARNVPSRSFGCLELVLYGIRVLADHYLNHLNQ